MMGNYENRSKRSNVLNELKAICQSSSKTMELKKDNFVCIKKREEEIWRSLFKKPVKEIGEMFTR